MSSAVPSGTPPVLPARYQRRRHQLVDNPWRRARIGVAAFAAVLVAGTLAYRVLLGLTWVDAGYQTLITVTTVGFAEVGAPPTPPTGW